ncbi:MAG: uroporphyrinogen-III synthase [Bacteroidota bacterium]
MKIKNILVSQPPPIDLEKSPYAELAKKHNFGVDFLKFFAIEEIKSTEFRKDRINLSEYDAVIFTSRNAVDHYFRICKEMRYEVPDTMKYFCNSEAIALYLQKYIQYRKRKIFYGKQTNQELIEVLKKHKNNKTLLPCSDLQKLDLTKLLEKNKIKYTRAIIYKTISVDLSQVDLNKYQMLVLFSPAGVRSLFDNYPEFVQGETIIAAFGAITAKALKEFGLTLNIAAPTKTAPAMSVAIEQYLEKNCKKK